MLFPPTSKSNKDSNFVNDPILPLHCISEEPIEKHRLGITHNAIYVLLYANYLQVLIMIKNC